MPCPHFGNLPKDYNKSIHGPFYPFRYYGKPDTPFAEVKLTELGSWLNRRNIHPVAIFRAFSRAIFRHGKRFIDPRYAYPGIGFNQRIWAVCLLFYILNYKTIRHHKMYKHHW
ncbi:putative ATP synthase subunit f, mitochondrial [Oppia nitens]|uniref:putative ATP synthase subunit f, mitochondrial n=1 Tax=Oppia nitens TaxID=1686743 RepID=UPI0023DAB7DA|nr:putative ATP synthase subunit f, mitochondrial [Oppia nitens]